MPTAVALSQWTGVLGCGCPSSSSVNQKIMPSLQFRKRAASSALAAEATTNQRSVHKVKNAPFKRMGSFVLGDHPIKKCPHALLRASVSERYEATECMFIIMSEAWKRTVASG